MMKDNKGSSILDSIIKAEGGYWNDPIGGPTKFGITQKTLNSVRKRFPSVGLPEKVMYLDESAARLILSEEYIKAKNVLSLPYPTSLFHGHMVVMSWDDGIRIMQSRLGLKSDGIIGPKTLAAVEAMGTFDQLVGIAEDVSEFLETRTNQFVKSYYNRFNSILF